MDRQKPVKTLPCPQLRLRAVKTNIFFNVHYWSNEHATDFYGLFTVIELERNCIWGLRHLINLPIIVPFQELFYSLQWKLDFRQSPQLFLCIMAYSHCTAPRPGQGPNSFYEIVWKFWHCTCPPLFSCCLSPDSVQCKYSINDDNRKSLFSQAISVLRPLFWLNFTVVVNSRFCCEKKREYLSIISSNCSPPSIKPRKLCIFLDNLKFMAK